MTIRSALLLTVPLALAGCQAKTASDDKAKMEAERAALEQRLQELERQLNASPSPMPEAGTGASSTAASDSTEKMRTSQAPGKPAAGISSIPEAVPSREDFSSRESRQTPPVGEPYSTAAVEPVVRPRAERWVLPEGTELTLILETPVSSVASQEGDAVVARVERAVGPEGNILLPGGTLVKGRVAEAISAGRVRGRARLSVDFDRIVVRGRAHELDGARISSEANDEHGRDAKVIGGSSAAGAVLGAIADGKKGFLRGAIIGAGVGGGAVLATKGRDIELPAGSRWKVRISETVHL